MKRLVNVLKFVIYEHTIINILKNIKVKNSNFIKEKNIKFNMKSNSLPLSQYIDFQLAHNLNKAKRNLCSDFRIGGNVFYFQIPGEIIYYRTPTFN